MPILVVIIKYKFTMALVEKPSDKMCIEGKKKALDSDTVNHVLFIYVTH